MSLMAKELLKMVKKQSKETTATPVSKPQKVADVQPISTDDEEIKDIFLRTRPTIKIIGCGGAGCA